MVVISKFNGTKILAIGDLCLINIFTRISLEAPVPNQEEWSEAVGVLKLSKNIVIKTPMIQEGIKAVKILNEISVKTNVTQVFSIDQSILIKKAGATYVSPIIGILGDTGHLGMQIVNDMVKIFKIYDINTKIIVASIRHSLHVTEGAKEGAHTATVQFNVFKKMLKHPLTTIGLEKDLKKGEFKV